MTTPTVAGLQARLAVPGVDSVFEEPELAGMPEPVRRYFRAAVSPGTPIALAARVKMRGHIKLGSRWVRFRANETLAPHKGFVWAGRAGGIISGSDHYADGQGVLDWRLFGLVRVAHAAGPDVTRSAAGRLGGEAVWLPTALLPRFGVSWSAAGDSQVTAAYSIDDLDFSLQFDVDDDGHLRTVRFQRWGDPNDVGRFGWYPFGMTVTGYTRFAGMMVPAAGRVGWHHGTERWSDGEFFRYQLTDVKPVCGAG